MPMIYTASILFVAAVAEKDDDGKWWYEKDMLIVKHKSDDNPKEDPFFECVVKQIIEHKLKKLHGIDCDIIFIDLVDIDFEVC